MAAPTRVLLAATGSGHCGGVDLEQVAVELYGLDPDEFTAARNHAAAEAKNAGEVAASTAIKALRQPTLAAWLANQLVRAEPDRVDELTQLGDELREAHLTHDGTRLRELTPRRHDLVDELVQAGRALAAGGGRKVTDAVADRLTETLDAALVDPTAGQMLRSGRLTSALRHVGFGVVDEAGEPAQISSIAPRAKAAPPRPAKKATPRPAIKKAGTAAADRKAAEQRAAERQRKELEARFAEVEAEYAEAEADRVAAESELDANEHHIADMQTAVERLSEELEQARTAKEGPGANPETGARANSRHPRRPRRLLVTLLEEDK